MKKRIVRAAVALLLCMFLLPVFRGEAEAQETVSENSAVAYSYNEEFLETLDLMALDWRSCTDEAISHAVMMKDWYEVGMWLTAMSAEDREELLARDTDLNSIVQDPEAGCPSVSEYATTFYQKKSMMLRASYPRNASGYWTTNIVNGATGQVCSIKHKLTGFDKDVSTGKTQSLTLTPTISGVNWCGATCDSGTKSTYTLKGDSTYTVVPTHVAYNKPAGYTATVTYSHTGNMHQLYFDGTLYGATYANTSTKELTDSSVRRIYPTNPNMTAYNASTYAGNIPLISLVNVYRLAGIGCTGSSSYTGENLIQTITLNPIAYNVNYNGNGATGGGVSAQNCSFGKAYTIQNNGYSKAYTVTYNGNGGTPAVTAQTAKYVFKGWGNGTTAKVTHTPGAAFSNLTTTANGVINMHAIWNPASVTLTSATRKGYQFQGWNIGKAGAVYTPAKDVTAVASWSPNTYEIALDANNGFFADGSGAEQEETPQAEKTISAVYDEVVSLPRPSRAGYQFEGWRGENGIYQEEAENLTDVQGALVLLRASWIANGNTPYTILRYKQTSSGAGDYMLFDEQAGDAVSGTEVLYGTTDTTVTVPAVNVKGYVTPDDQMIKIAGDGCAVVSFYYRLDAESGQGGTGAPPAVTQDGSIPSYKREETVTETSGGNREGLNLSVIIGGEKYEIVRRENGTCTIVLSEAKGTKVVIPETVTIGGMSYRITAIDENAFRGNENIEQVIIPGTVTAIGDSAFYGCTRLKKVTLSEGLLMIGNKAFYKCSALSSIKIPKSVITIGKYAFAKCSKLKKVTFAGGSGLLSLGTGAFSDCKALKKIKLPSKLTGIPAKAFYNCKKLKTVTIGKSVSEIGRKAFYKCKMLKKVTIKTEKLTRIGSKAFKKCKKGIVFVVPGLKKASYQKLLKGKW